MSTIKMIPSAEGKKLTSVSLCLGSGEEIPGVSTIIVYGDTLVDVSNTVTTLASFRLSLISVLILSTCSSLPSSKMISAQFLVHQSVLHI